MSVKGCTLSLKDKRRILVSGAVVVALAVVAVGTYVLALGPGGTRADIGPFSMGVIYGTRDAYSSNPGSSSGSDAPYRNPAALEAYYQPWFNGRGTSTKSSLEITNTRMGVGAGDLANCTASKNGDPQSCFGPDHFAAWAPGHNGWHGQLDLQVPMLSAGSVPVPYTSAAALLAIKKNLEYGAYGTGEVQAPGPFPYADNYRNLAAALVANRLGHSYITIAPESQGHWYSTQFGPDPNAWARYFGNIRKAMMSAPGAQFRFVWAMGLLVSTTRTDGTSIPTMEAAYPGDGAVDVVAVDWTDGNLGSVDINGRSTPEPYPGGDCTGVLPGHCRLNQRDWAKAWKDWYLPATNTAMSVYGLQWWADFAQAHGKQFALAAWGLASGGDNGYLIHQVWVWLTHLPHGLVAFETYQTDPVTSYWTNANGQFADSVLWPAQPGVTDGTIYRQAPCVYLKWFGGQSGRRCGRESKRPAAPRVHS